MTTPDHDDQEIDVDLDDTTTGGKPPWNDPDADPYDVDTWDTGENPRTPAESAHTTDDGGVPLPPPLFGDDQDDDESEVAAGDGKGRSRAGMAIGSGAMLAIILIAWAYEQSQNEDGSLLWLIVPAIAAALAGLGLAVIRRRLRRGLGRRGSGRPGSRSGSFGGRARGPGRSGPGLFGGGGGRRAGSGPRAAAGSRSGGASPGPRKKAGSTPGVRPGRKPSPGPRATGGASPKGGGTASPKRRLGLPGFGRRKPGPGATAPGPRGKGPGATGPGPRGKTPGSGGGRGPFGGKGKGKGKSPGPQHQGAPSPTGQWGWGRGMHPKRSWWRPSSWGGPHTASEAHDARRKRAKARAKRWRRWGKRTWKPAAVGATIAATWWALPLWGVIAAPLAAIGALWGVPAAWRSKRAQRLRKQLRKKLKRAWNASKRFGARHWRKFYSWVGPSVRFLGRQLKRAGRGIWRRALGPVLRPVGRMFRALWARLPKPLRDRLARMGGWFARLGGRVAGWWRKRFGKKSNPTSPAGTTAPQPFPGPRQKNTGGPTPGTSSPSRPPDLVRAHRRGPRMRPGPVVVPPPRTNAPLIKRRLGVHPLVQQLADAYAAIGAYQPEEGALEDARALLASLGDVHGEDAAVAYANLSDSFRERLPRAPVAADGLDEFGAASAQLADHAYAAENDLYSAHEDDYDRIAEGDTSMDAQANNEVG